MFKSCVDKILICWHENIKLNNQTSMVQHLHVYESNDWKLRTNLVTRDCEVDRMVQNETTRSGLQLKQKSGLVANYQTI